MKSIVTFLTFSILPLVLFSQDAPPNFFREHALRVEYNLVVPRYDSLINYYVLPYKKILTISKEEALLQNYVAGYDPGFKVYYDLKFNFFYKGFEQYYGKAYLSKNKWIKRGRTVAVSKQANHDVLGIPCKAIQVKSNLDWVNDTLLLFATDKFGLNFFELGEIDGLALEYELEFEHLGKVKYQAAKIDTVVLLDGKLADIPSFRVEERGAGFKKRLRIDKQNKRRLERFDRKMTGSKARWFKEWDVNNNLVKSKDYKGKIRVLHFWSGYPPSSFTEFSCLNKVVEKYKNADDIAFISFAAVQSKFAVRETIRQFPLKYTVCYNAYIAAESYKCPFFPVHVVVDQEGKIAKYIYGSYPDIAKQLIATIEKLRR